MKHSYPAVVAAILAVIFCADVIIAAQIDLPRVEAPLRLAGDVTGDCIVDLQDIEEFTRQWLDQGICLGRVDIDDDGTVSFHDFSKLARDWLANNNP